MKSSMEPLNKVYDPGQVERLEKTTRYAMEALELCAAIGDYQTSLNKFKNRKDIFERAMQGLRQIVPISFYAFYAIDELSHDIVPEHCDAPEDAAYISETVDYLIEKGVVALAFREKRTLAARSRDRKYHLLIHTLATTAKSYGIFFCFLEAKPVEWSIVDKMTTIIIKSTCYALENFELYQLIDQKNAALTDKNVQLSRSEIVYRNTFENTGNPTIVVNSDGVITYSNSQFTDFSGWDCGRLVNRKKISDFIKGGGRRTGFSRILRQADQDRTKEQPTEYIFENREARQRSVFLKISPLGIADQYIVSLNDVTAVKEAQRQLQFQAFHDPLTHLPNRVLFQDRLKQAIKKKKRYRDYNFAVVFIDLDRFKTINDTLGHNVGDTLLVQAAARINECVRDVDTVARFGGDEFLILLEDVHNKANCEVVTRRILERFQTPMQIGGHEILVSLSMGVLIGGEQEMAQTDVVRLADMSMYEAKKRGRNRVVYSHEIPEKEIEKKLYLENQLQKAIQQGEFFVQYQPLMDLTHNRLYGLETLVRWKHPELGIIAPGSFIPIAEETGLIIPLGRVVFELAFNDFARWREHYPHCRDLYLNINLSVKQMAEEGLAADIQKLAEAAGLPLEYVTLEITESVFIEDTARAIETINSLKALGISISIDDFGTGYASLKYLNQFAIDLVKIDKLLIDNITVNETNFNIVASMLDLCRKLNLKVMAEGIEAADQVEKLRLMNCGLGQGYYFYPPQDKSATESLLQSLRN